MIKVPISPIKRSNKSFIKVVISCVCYKKDFFIKQSHLNYCIKLHEKKQRNPEMRNNKCFCFYCSGSVQQFFKPNGKSDSFIKRFHFQIKLQFLLLQLFWNSISISRPIRDIQLFDNSFRIQRMFLLWNTFEFYDL